MNFFLLNDLGLVFYIALTILYYDSLLWLKFVLGSFLSFWFRVSFINYYKILYLILYFEFLFE